MKGKHQKKIPLVKKLAVAFLITGIVMVITAFALEARYIPWGKLFGTASQSEDSIPDPTPPSVIISTLAPITNTPAQPTPSATPPVESAEPEETEEVEEMPQLEYLGILKIPVLNVAQNLYSGSGMDEMKYGVGHVTGTAMPGEKGNCAITGHRPYPFRYLDTLDEGDNVIVKIDDIVYTYKVYESFDVLPEETWVLDNIKGEDYTLTLITCTPYMVSSHRLIVRARLSDIDGLTPAEYYGEEGEEPLETDGDEVRNEEWDGADAPEDTEAPESAEDPEVTPEQTPGENEEGEAETEEPADIDPSQDTEAPEKTEIPQETEEARETEIPQEIEEPQEPDSSRDAQEPQETTDISQETDALQQPDETDVSAQMA